MHRYCSHYCEENIWHLCAEPAFAERETYAVFIAADAGHCPLWAQRAAPPGELVAWDYHVVALSLGDSGWAVWDLDTRLGLPVSLDDYLEGTFVGSDALPRAFQPRFRRVPRDEYLATFASDRSHMRDARGRFVQPPPPWPVIGSGAGTNLRRFVDMNAAFVGEVTDLAGLRARFGG